MMLRKCLFVAILAGMPMLMMGCSSGIEEPELGKVNGTVTLDGKPAAELLITFEPQASGGAAKDVGAASTGVTDASGNYELTYKGVSGAVIGTHTVRVTSAAGGGDAGGESAAVQVNIPAKFNSSSTLTREVKDGENTIDLEITTR